METFLPSENIITKTDSYKVTHWKQYPPNTTTVSSFFAARGGLFPSTLFFGLQYILKRHLVGRVVDTVKILRGREFWTEHFFGDSSVYNEAGWKRIERVHGGRLPIVIRAVPEGTIVPTGNALLTIENTDPQLPWVTLIISRHFLRRSGTRLQLPLIVMAWYSLSGQVLKKRVICHCCYSNSTILDFAVQRATKRRRLVGQVIL